MKLSFHLIFIMLLTIVAFAGCREDSDDNNSDDASQKKSGGCTEEENGETYCWEVQKGDVNIQAECLDWGGEWSDSGCDTSLYATKCVEEAVVQINDNPAEERTEVYYYIENSTIECWGDESNL
ncbi:MAG: hypothetical protein JXR76_17645 [Deltaproteobacteria bacterium]|nr:hypothetical protein [Deltaproteobacteria bacterium]